MDRIDKFIKRHLIKYPLSEEIDIYKLVYQSFFLTNHLITEKTYFYLLEEIKQDIENPLLYEYICDNVVRVNLYLYKNNFSIDYLFESFKNSKKTKEESFKEYLDKISIVDLKHLHTQYKSNLVSHSKTYKDNYFPSYRIIKTTYLTFEMRLFKLNKFINEIRKEDKITIVCFEGLICSGKTTFAKNIKDATVISVDDHFKDPIDYDYLEKFLENIKLNKNKTVTETCYNCSTKSYYEIEKEIKNLVIVEGNYSYHKRLNKFYDKIIYFVVDEQTQLERLKNRESEESLNNFINKWLVNEKKHYKNLDLISCADILI